MTIGSAAPTSSAGPIASPAALQAQELVPITRADFDVELALAYATPGNVTGKQIYRHADCYLHPEAARLLRRAIELAKPLGLRFKIFDAYRPVEAQWALWNAFPDPEFVSDPRKGGIHTRGVAVDLTLIDTAGNELDMGTEFDSFAPQAHHGRTDVSELAQRNRFLLLGLMSAAGWDFYQNEWWHYQLFRSRDYPVVDQNSLPRPMM
ncbi:D-alanyl-D-alanine dipeptidase [Dongia soli]|uniref:D-alanyl-D-alanine dipeptidase n=1 Tax=Dongia soli TaxID=600628 RepID=A0ABU5E7L1_9PROT|nr:D-alanyl-D-alanine dipeptidase [Dongia soli]MDY0882173.1 D-alanyl-D-alanine dipeptidase [Dongia soli]